MFCTKIEENEQNCDSIIVSSMHTMWRECVKKSQTKSLMFPYSAWASMSCHQGLRLRLYSYNHARNFFIFFSLILLIGNIIFCCLLFFSSLQNSWIAVSSFLVLRQRRIPKHFFTARWNSHALDAQISGFRIHRAFYLAFWPCLNTYPVSKETETQALHTLCEQLIVVMSTWWVDTACYKGKRHWNRTFMHLRM